MINAVTKPVKAILPDWPEWALDNLIVMSLLLVLTLAVTSLYSEDDEDEGEKEQDKKNETSKANGVSNSATKQNGTSQNHHSQQQHHELLKKFYSFRQKYTTVYLVIMLADWMQGTHMYTLYMSYGVNISALFLTGFLSGGIFAPFLGSFVDKFGRKRSCIIYCLLEIAINVMEGYQNFTILLLGRVMGGVSTNLLFSAFESWMATEHRKQGFPEEWLSRTYSMCSIINGSTAILAGIVAQLLEDAFGHIGPFHGAVGLTTLALVLILGWEENYGEESAGDHNKSSLGHQFIEGWSHTIKDSRIWRIGLTQALSEGAMYTFVFMWVPTLLSLSPPGGVPTGCVFSSLMMSITMGGLCYPALQGFIRWALGSKESSAEICASIVYLLAAVSMGIPVLCLSSYFSGAVQCTDFVLVSFLIVEFCVGLFMPVAGTLRSKYVPDALQGAILNIFRLPLNAIVVSGTYATDHLEPSVVFTAVSGCFLAAALLQATMISQGAPKTKAD